MTVAEAIADWLAEKEITHAFGIVGAGNLPLWEAISRKEKTQIVCCHHEAAAATAASFFARTNGLVGVAVVTTGAGSTNAITGVMAAYMDSTPLLVLSGNEPLSSLRMDTRVLGVQGYRSANLADTFTKYAYIYDPTFPISNYLDSAWQSALSGRQGPVWIDLPRDTQNEAD